MAEFKLVISDPKTGKSYQKEVKEDRARTFVGMRVGQAVKGESIDLTGYELEVTGGSDRCGFPMRKGINLPRKKILAKGSVGVKKHKFRGTFLKKTVCGRTIGENISQINLKVTKEGKKPLEEEFKAAEGEAPKEEVKKEEKPKEKKKEEAPKKEKKEEPKKEEAPKEEPKAEEKPKKEVPKEEKPKEEPKKEEAPKEEPRAEEKPKEEKK